MATLLEDMSAEEKISWNEDHLFNKETGGFKKGLSWNQIMSMLNPLANLRIAEVMGTL